MVGRRDSIAFAWRICGRLSATAAGGLEFRQLFKASPEFKPELNQLPLGNIKGNPIEYLQQVLCARACELEDIGALDTYQGWQYEFF